MQIIECMRASEGVQVVIGGDGAIKIYVIMSQSMIIIGLVVFCNKEYVIDIWAKFKYCFVKVWKRLIM